MAWYRTGTVSVVNGSDAVTGTGTSWFGALQAGWGFVGPDGRTYEIESVESATGLTLKTNYQGSSASGQLYACFPTMSLATDLTTAIQTLIADFQGTLDGPGEGKFPDGTEALPGVSFTTDPDSGFRRVSSNKVALVTGGADQLVIDTAGVVTGDAVQSDAYSNQHGQLVRWFTSGGIFGLGNTLAADELGDVDATNTASGWYRLTLDTPNVASLPFGAANGMCVVERFNSVNVKQTVWRTSGDKGGMFWRVGVSGIWSDWFQMWDSVHLPHETGEFAMVLEDMSSNSVTQGSKVIPYTRNAGLVTCGFNFVNNLDTTGLTAGDDIRIPLPFVAGGNSFCMVSLNQLTPSGPFMLYAKNGESYAYLRNTANNINLTVSDINNGSTDLIGGMLVYHTT